MSIINSFSVANKQSGCKLYFDQSGSLSFGEKWAQESLVYLFVKGSFGFLVVEKEIRHIVKLCGYASGFSLVDIISRKFFSTNPRNKDAKNNFIADRDKASAWEFFDLNQEAKDTEWLFPYFEIIENISASKVFLETAHFDVSKNRCFFEYCIGLVSPFDLVNFIKEKSNCIELSRSLSRFSEFNFFLKSILKRICDDTFDLSSNFIGRDMDFIGHYIDPKSPWIFLNSCLRQAITPTHKSCIVATARNEGIYILEWIAYHLELGFEKIFLYTNDNQDGSLDLLKSLDAEGVIELIISEVGTGGNAQIKAYNHAILANSDVMQYEWCAFIDVDEFVSIDKSKFSDVNEFLDWAGAGGASTIALNWILVANPVISENWMQRPLTQRLTKRSKLQSYLIKCISKPQEICFSGPHYPLGNFDLSPVVINSERKRYFGKSVQNPQDITQALTPTTQNAYIYHYEAKSFPELLWKYSRNRGNYSAVTSDIFINESFLSRIRHFIRCMEHDVSQSVDLTIRPEVLNKRIDSLLSIQAVSASYSAVIARTSERYSKLLEYLPAYLERELKTTEEREAKVWIQANFLNK